MPRPIVLANDRLLIGFDGLQRLRELHFPQRGLFDHVSGRMIRMGVWVAGAFAWCDGDGWTRTQTYRKGSLTALQTLVHTELGLAIESEDCIPSDVDVLIRSFRVKNLRSDSVDVRLFFNHDVIIDESDVGNTAMFHPGGPGVMHFKGKTAILFAGEPFFQYHTGIKFADQPGTAWDAEDGDLHGKPIEQGAVDSTMSLRLQILPGSSAEATYCVACGETVEAALAAYLTVKAKPLADWRREVLQDAKAVVAKATALTHLSGEIREFCERSALILQTQIDPQGGITAANDSDIMIGNRGNYSYVWPRDGALVAQVLDLAGDHAASRRYFEYCSRLGIGERGTFLQKYRTDGALGATWHPWLDYPALPIQEDETSLTLLALRDHLRTNAIDEPCSLPVRPMLEALLRLRDPKTDLPTPSYDLWEERFGVHTFTVASVIAALEAGAELVPDLASEATAAAEAMRAALRTHLFDHATGGFHRMLHPDGRPDPTVDSATLQVALLGALPVDDPMVLANQRRVRKRLTVRTEVGGIARYEGDWYWRLSHDYAGNPWVISTMWMAQLRIRQAKHEKDLLEPMHDLRWAMRLAGPTGILAEQYHPDTGEALSVSPLTWSHAEVLRTALMLGKRREEFTK